MLVDVVLEFGLLDLDVDDVVHAGAVHVQRTRVGADHRHRQGTAELAPRRDQLKSDITDLSTQMLRDDEHAHFNRSLTMSEIWRAISAGLPWSTWAPSPLGGANIRRTR